MEAHLETCSSCARFESNLRKGMDLIYRSGEISLPPGFRTRILKDIEKSSKVAEPIMPGSAGLAAAAMVTAAITLVVFESHPAPEPVAESSVPAAEFQFPQLIPPPRAPFVDFTEFEIPNPDNVLIIPADSAVQVRSDPAEGTP